MLQNPAGCRSGTAPCTPASIAEALYCAFHHAPNGKSAQQIAGELGRSYAYWIAAVDPQRGDRPFPVADLERLLMTAGTVMPLRFLATRVGWGLFALPTSATTGSPINQRVLRVLKELGELSAVLEQIQADGRVESAEGARAIRELREVFEELVGLEAEIATAAQLPTGKPAAARMTLPRPATRQAVNE